MAAYDGHTEVAKVLLALGADVNHAEVRHHRTPIVTAVAVAATETDVVAFTPILLFSPY